MATIEIKRWDNDRVIYSAEAESLRSAVESAFAAGANLARAYLAGANLSGAYLAGTNLVGANLVGADLAGANLVGADLAGANLARADLAGADLAGANLDGADLAGADLAGTRINWRSHALLAEILRRAAGEDVERRKVAGLVAISRDWCWSSFGRLKDDPLFDWALDALAGWVQPDDGAPRIVRDRAGARAEAPAS